MDAENTKFELKSSGTFPQKKKTRSVPVDNFTRFTSAESTPNGGKCSEKKMDNGENSPPTIPELSFPFAAIFSLKKKKRKTIGGKQTAAFSCHEAYFLGGHLNFLIRKCCAAEVNTKKKSFSPAPIHSFISIGWGVWISFWWNELLWVHSSSVADSSGAGGPTFSTNRFHSKYAPHTREFISTQKTENQRRKWKSISKHLIESCIVESKQTMDWRILRDS